MSSDESEFQENIDDSIEIEDAIAENARLRELNLQLKSQNIEIQEQFDSAMDSIQKMELVNKENMQIKSQLYDLKALNDELKQRLVICDETKNDLTKKVETALQNSEREHQDELQQIQAQLLSIQNQSKIENNMLLSKIQTSEKILMNTQTDNAVLQNQLGKIIKLSGNFFHCNFDDVKQLTDHLMHPPPEGQDMQQNQSNAEDNKNKSKLKKVKSLLNEERARCKQLELEVIQLRQNLQTETAKFSSQLNESQDRERKLQNSINSLQNDHKQEVVNLQKKINGKKMHSMITQTTEIDFSENELVAKANQENEKLRSQLRETQNSLSQQQTQLDALNAQSQDENTIKEKMRQKTQKARAKNEIIVRDLKEAQRRINSLTEKLEKAKEEKGELESQIQAFHSSSDDVQSQVEFKIKELEHTKNALEILEKHMTEQAEEISQITKDRDHLLALVHTQNQALQDTEALISNLQENIKPEAHYHNNSKSNDKSQAAPEEWNFGSLPEDLKSILRGIAENDGFTVEKRVAQIFSVVSRYFTNRENESTHKINELNDKVKNCEKTLTDFATSILHEIDEDSLDLNEIVEAIANLYKEKLGLQQKNNELENAPVVCDQQTFNEMNETIESLQGIAKSLRNKSKQRKQELHECKEAFITVKNKSDEELQTMKNTNDKSRETIDLLQKQLDDLHAQNKELLEELNETKDCNMTEYNNAQSELEQILMEQSSKFEDLKKDYDRQVHERDDTISVYHNKVDEYEKSVKKWEEMSRNANDETRNLKSQLNKIITEKDEQYARMLHQKEKEANQIERKYQTMIEQLNIKNTETENIVQSMTKGIEEYEQKMRQMTQQMTSVQFDLQKADLKAQSQIDSIERTKKLAIAQLRAQLMATETKYSLKADEQKHAWEAEKRNLFGYIAQQFGSFFDAKQSLNEESFKQVVNKVKGEMERHKKQEQTIRKLLKAKESQTTEDALADLVLSLHPQLQQKTGRF